MNIFPFLSDVPVGWNGAQVAHRDVGDPRFCDTGVPGHLSAWNFRGQILWDVNQHLLALRGRVS